jgi:hypothetical protein
MLLDPCLHCRRGFHLLEGDSDGLLHRPTPLRS